MTELEKGSEPLYTRWVNFYMQKTRGAVLKILGTGAHFQGRRAQNACRVKGPRSELELSELSRSRAANTQPLYGYYTYHDYICFSRIILVYILLQIL